MKTNTQLEYTSSVDIEVGSLLKSTTDLYYFIRDKSGSSSPYTYTFNGDFTTTANALVSLKKITGIAYGDYSHAEGYATTAYKECCHTEGAQTAALSECAHAEGSGSVA